MAIFGIFFVVFILFLGFQFGVKVLKNYNAARHVSLRSLHRSLQILQFPESPHDRAIGAGLHHLQAFHEFIHDFPRRARIFPAHCF